MQHVTLIKPSVFAIAMAAALTPFAASADELDFGLEIEQRLKAHSEKLFGVEQPLEASAPTVSMWERKINPRGSVPFSRARMLARLGPER